MSTDRIRINETPAVAEFLYEEFMKPSGISARRLSGETRVPHSRILGIIHGKRRINADTSLRLAKFFGVSDRFFLNIQNDIDIRNYRMEHTEELNRIKPFNGQKG